LRVILSLNLGPPRFFEPHVLYHPLGSRPPGPDPERSLRRATAGPGGPSPLRLRRDLSGLGKISVEAKPLASLAALAGGGGGGPGGGGGGMAGKN